MDLRVIIQESTLSPFALALHPARVSGTRSTASGHNTARTSESDYNLLFVSDPAEHRVRVFNASSGQYLRDLPDLSGFCIYGIVTCMGPHNQRLVIACDKGGTTRIVVDSDN